MALIGTLLGRLLKQGSLTIVEPNGQRATYGPGGGKALTLRFTDRYLVQPVVASWGSETPKGGEPVEDGFNYRSDNNDLWLEVEDMRELLEDK